MNTMIPIWQAVIAVLVTGGIGTLVGVAIMAALAMAGDTDRRMGLK
jgi:hypothetical protein